MIDVLLIGVLILLIVLSMRPTIEGNENGASDDDTQKAILMTQQAAGDIEYINNTVQSGLDMVGGDINEVYNTATEDNQQNTQDINNYKATISQSSDPYESGNYDETGNTTPS